MEVRCSSPLSKQFATGPKFEPDKSSLHPPNKSLRYQSILILFRRVSLNNSSGFLPSGFPAVLHACYVSGSQSLLLDRYCRSCNNILATGFHSLQLYKVKLKFVLPFTLSPSL